MRTHVWFALLAGAAWGLGGYFEKLGLARAGLPPIVGVTVRTTVALVVLGLLSLPAWRTVEPTRAAGPWLAIVLGGGVLAGSLGMWSFYSALARTDQLGVTLAVAFAASPVAGTLVAVLRGEQKLDLPTAAGTVAIVAGIVLVQLGRGR